MGLSSRERGGEGRREEKEEDGEDKEDKEEQEQAQKEDPGGGQGRLHRRWDGVLCNSEWTEGWRQLRRCFLYVVCCWCWWSWDGPNGGVDCAFCFVVSMSGVGFDVHYRLLYCVLFVSWDGATGAVRPTVRCPSCVSVCGAVVAERSVLKVAVVMVGLRLSVETPSSSLLWSESQLLAAVPAGAGAADRYSTPRPPGAALLHASTRLFSFFVFFCVSLDMASRRERVKMAEHSEREAGVIQFD